MERDIAWQRRMSEGGKIEKNKKGQRDRVRQ